MQIIYPVRDLCTQEILWNKNWLSIFLLKQFCFFLFFFAFWQIDKVEPKIKTLSDIFWEIEPLKPVLHNWKKISIVSSFQIPKKSLENGTYLRHSAQQMRQMRSWCLKNEPDAPLESVYKDGRREILRYAGERVTSPKTTLVHIHGGGYVFGSPGRNNLSYSKLWRAKKLLRYL